MKALEKLTLEELLNLLINEETNDLEKIRVKKFVLDNFTESPQSIYLQVMEELKEHDDEQGYLINSRLCARDLADHLLKNMNIMSFRNLRNICEEKISLNENLCGN